MLHDEREDLQPAVLEKESPTHFKINEGPLIINRNSNYITSKESLKSDKTNETFPEYIDENHKETF